MKKERFQNFDTHGFWFFLKSTGFIILLVFLFEYGSQVVWGEILPQTPEEVRALQDGQDPSSLVQVKEGKYAQEEDFLEARVIEGQILKNVVPEKGRFVGVDLVNMKVALYQDGSIIKILPVLSKGRSGSHWETPAGIYEFKTKERNHFSSIAEVYMPYSMQFFGNYFIHGRPYYPDGERVSEEYSNGGIRLSSEDAQKVYDFASVGTGVFVYEDKKTKPQQTGITLRSGEEPEVDATSYIMADLDTGQVLAEKNADKQYPIASITKLMTAVVANDTIRFDSRVPLVDSGVDVPEDVSEISEKLLIGELIYPLLLESNNLVADSLSAYSGEGVFLKGMNERARVFGMEDTSFADASGLSAENISTAEDLFYLAQHIEEKNSFIFNMTREDSRSIISNSGKEYVFENKTHFLDRDDYLGGKIGYTPRASETMLALFEVSSGVETHRIAVVVLGADERDQAVLSLLNWLEDTMVAKNTFL